MVLFEEDRAGRERRTCSISIRDLIWSAGGGTLGIEEGILGGGEEEERRSSKVGERGSEDESGGAAFFEVRSDEGDTAESVEGCEVDSEESFISPLLMV